MAVIKSGASTDQLSIDATSKAARVTIYNSSGTEIVPNAGVAQGSTTSGQTGSLVQGAVTTAAPSYTTAQTSPLSLTTAGGLRTDMTTLAGTTVSTGNGIAGTGVQRVTIASDNTAFSVNATCTNAGTFAVQATDNVTQFGGTNLSTGTGAGGAGIPRVTVSNDSNVLVTPPTLTKATQGSTGFSVQELKDAGRVNLSFYANAVASGTTGTETAITLTKSADTGATSSAASFVITSGKRFRITHISVASRGHNTATAQITTFSLRINTAGAVTTGSTPIVFAAASATPATANAWDRYIIPIPDGMEYLGDGTIQFGLTANAVFTTNAPTWFVNILGFEY